MVGEICLLRFAEGAASGIDAAICLRPAGSEGILPVEWGEAIVEKGGSFALVRYRIHDCQTLVTVLGIALLLLDTAAAAVIWPLSMRRSG